MTQILQLYIYEIFARKLINSLCEENYHIILYVDLGKQNVEQFHVTFLIMMLSEIPAVTVLINHRVPSM